MLNMNNIINSNISLTGYHGELSFKVEQSTKTLLSTINVDEIYGSKPELKDCVWNIKKFVKPDDKIC